MGPVLDGSHSLTHGTQLYLNWQRNFVKCLCTVDKVVVMTTEGEQEGGAGGGF